MRKNKEIQKPWIKEVHLPPMPEPSTNTGKKKVSKKKRKKQEEEIRQLTKRIMMEPLILSNQEPTIIIHTTQYEKMQSDIQDLTATIEALEGVIEEQRTNNKRLQDRLEEVMGKYRALMESYHQVQGW